MMELISFRSAFIRNDRDKSLWQFLRQVHFSYLIMFPIKLNAILNEYLFIMYTKYNLHKDRFIRSPIPVSMETYSDDHLIYFQRIVSQPKNNEENILNDGFLEMILFYTELMNFVSDTLKERFMYGKIFNAKEIGKLIEESTEHPLKGYCQQKEIKIRVPKKSFGLGGYESNHHFKGKILYFEIGDFLEIVFDNSHKIFAHRDIWDVKMSIIKATNFYVIWEELSDDEVIIYFEE